MITTFLSCTALITVQSASPDIHTLCTTLQKSRRRPWKVKLQRLYAWKRNEATECRHSKANWTWRAKVSAATGHRHPSLKWTHLKLTHALVFVFGQADTCHRHLINAGQRYTPPRTTAQVCCIVTDLFSYQYIVYCWLQPVLTSNSAHSTSTPRPTWNVGHTERIRTFHVHEFTSPICHASADKQRLQLNHSRFVPGRGRVRVRDQRASVLRLYQIFHSVNPGQCCDSMPKTRQGRSHPSNQALWGQWKAAGNPASPYTCTHSDNLSFEIPRRKALASVAQTS